MEAIELVDCVPNSRKKKRPECQCGCGEELKRAGANFLKGHRSFEVREKYNKNLNRWIVRHGDKWLYRYRVIMEQHIGRPLFPGEEVHHRNENSSDDRIENLRLYSSKSDHLKSEHENISIQNLEVANKKIKRITHERLN